MPLVQIAGKLVEFIHVPRCAGTSIENYLTGRYGRLGFLDRQALSRPASQRWSKSSPQHIEARARTFLIPDHWIHARFAVIRHPEARLLSVFLFQRDIERSIAPDATFEAWIDDMIAARAEDPHYLDNHPRPATELIPDDTTLFRLEDGLDPVIAWLDAEEGGARAGRSVPQVNDYKSRLAQGEIDPGPAPEVTKAARDKIHTYYAADFTRFDYPPVPEPAIDPAIGAATEDANS